jgi:hypothetical protein
MTSTMPMPTLAQTSYIIPTIRIDAFKHEMVKLNRRASKLGCSPLSFFFGEPIMLDFSREGERIEVSATPVTVTGTPPSFKDWSFAASVERLDTGTNLFHGISTKGIPERYRNSGHSCEHCNHQRNRNASYIIRHIDGDFRQVGSTCINDFLGGNALPAFNLYKSFDEKIKELGEFESFNSSCVMHIPVLSCLAAAASAIRRFGFVKKTGYEGEGELPNSLRVEAFLLDRKGSNSLEIEERDDEKAVLVREWLVNHDGYQNDYLQKLIDLAAATNVGVRNIGILTSAIAAYDREQEQKIVRGDSKHLGTVGEKITVEAELVSTKTLPGFGYGSPTLYTFRDGDGNILKWITQNLLDIDGKVVLTGKIKSHGEWNGVLETQLTRCKVG